MLILIAQSAFKYFLSIFLTNGTKICLNNYYTYSILIMIFYFANILTILAWYL